MKDKRMDNKERILHIQKAILDIEKFLKNTDEKEFLNNEILHNAVLMQFIIIGEAVVHVDENILNKYEYAWYKVRSFRNLIAHEYFNIKLIAVWEITQKDLDDLKIVIDEIIKKEF